MDFLKITKTVIRKLPQVCTIYTQSSPACLMEAIIFVMVFILLIYQLVHVSNILKKCSRNTHTIYCKIDTGAQGKEIICSNDGKKGSGQEPHAMVMDGKETVSSILHGNPNRTKLSEENKQFVENLLSMTPQQFVKMDKEQKMREKDFESTPNSLSTLSLKLVKKQWSDYTLKQNLATVIENLECNKMSIEGKYLRNKAGKMTESLLCILEHVVTTSSMERPLPFKGHITTLAVDAAELLQVNNSTEKNVISNNIELNAPPEDVSIIKNVNWPDENST